MSTVYNYIILEDASGFTSKERAEGISAELFAISMPLSARENGYKSNYLFNRIKKLDENKYALEVVLSTIINVHPDNNLDLLTSYMVDITQEEIDNLTAYIQSKGSFIFGNIIPSLTEIYDLEYMLDNNWISNVLE